MTTRYFLATLALLVHAGLWAQSSTLIFFSEDSENFILFVDGDRKNGTPMARVTAEGINADFVQVKVKFQASGVPDLTKQMLVESGMEMTTVIKKNKKGRYVLRPVSAVPAGSGAETMTVTEAASPEQEPMETVTTVTTTTTTQPVSTDADNASIGISVSDGENSINLNVDVGISGSATDVAVMEGSTTTTTTTTHYDGPAPSSSSNANCSAMSATDYARAKESITYKPFADEKMTVMKQILKAHCVSVQQVIGFVGLFTYEDDKLEVAKTAYSRTTDRSNYYQVNDALTYSGSIEELNRFLETQ